MGVRRGSLVFIVLLVEDHFLLHGHVSDRRGKSLRIQDGRELEERRATCVCLCAETVLVSSVCGKTGDRVWKLLPVVTRRYL
jgi:hypothetical protein